MVITEKLARNPARRLASLSACLLCCLVLIASISASAATPVNVSLTGLYPMTTTTVVTGPQRAAMARLAVEFIRADPTFNTYINFDIDFEDDRGDQTQAFINALDAVQTRNNKILLGPNRSAQSQLVSAVGSAFKIPILSYASSSPTLSSKNDYPNFFRTCPSDNQQTQVWVSLMQNYDWKQCAVLASNDAYGSGVSSALLNGAGAAGINVATVAYFAPTDTDFTPALDAVAHSKVKIIVLAAIAGGGGRRIMKQAALRGMMGPKSGYTWIIPEGSASITLLLNSGTESETTLSNADFRAALLGNIATKPRGGNGALWDSLISTWTSGALNSTLYPGSPSSSVVTTDVYVPYSVDAVYTIAHAFLSLVQQNISITGDHLKSALKNTSFVGVTGPVSFDSSQDRIVPYSILNLRDTTNLFEPIGVWSKDASGPVLTVSTQPIWPDGTTNVPGDGLPRTLFWIHWNSPTSIVILVFVGLALFACFLTIAFVARLAPTPVMRLASPWFLITTLVGLCLFFAGIITWMGQPSQATCTLREWLGHIGFCLAIAAIIAKTYRVDVIFRRRRKIKKVAVTNMELAKYVGLLMIPITVLLIVWTIVDRAKPAQVIDTTSNRINVVCKSKSSAWLIAAFVYDAALMIASLILSFRTRRVPDGFNETWYVYLSGYNTIVMGIIGVTLGYVLIKNIIAVTIVTAITQLIGGLTIWGLLFLPKLYVALIVPERNTASLTSTRTTHTGISIRGPGDVSHWKSTSDGTSTPTSAYTDEDKSSKNGSKKESKNTSKTNSKTKTDSKPESKTDSKTEGKTVRLEPVGESKTGASHGAHTAVESKSSSYSSSSSSEE